MHTLALMADVMNEHISGTNSGGRYDGEVTETRPTKVGQATLVGRFGKNVTYGIDVPAEHALDVSYADPRDPADTSSAAGLVDPFGVLFDSTTMTSFSIFTSLASTASMTSRAYLASLKIGKMIESFSFGVLASSLWRKMAMLTPDGIGNSPRFFAASSPGTERPARSAT